VAAHRERIAEEVLAVRLTLGAAGASPFSAEGNGTQWTASQVADVDGHSIRLALTKDGE
jgi:isoleucyl-tRNA synthetase